MADYTFFSAAHGNFSKIDNILAHKTNLNKCKENYIIPYILTDSINFIYVIKLEINRKENYKRTIHPH
jgi:hypothetical protein